jgi:hypothetical protein
MEFETFRSFGVESSWSECTVDVVWVIAEIPIH